MHFDKRKAQAILEASNLSIPQLAKRASLSISGTYHLLKSREPSDPKLSTVNALAQAMGCKSTDLISE